MGAFIISPLPPVLLEELRTAGPLRPTDITPLRRYYEPIRHPLVVGRLPGFAGYTAYPASALSGRDEEGFSSCSMHPCLRAVANHPAGATRRVNRLRRVMLPSPSRLRARPPGIVTYGATLRSLSLRPENSLPPLQMGCRGASDLWFPAGLPSSYGASDSYPGRTGSCWIHQPFLDAQPDWHLSAHPALQFALSKFWTVVSPCVNAH